MVAPTALKKKSIKDNTTAQKHIEEEEDELLLATELANEDSMEVEDSDKSNKVVLDVDGKPIFTKQAHSKTTNIKAEVRKVPVPPHRLAPLKQQWNKIYPPLVDHLKLQVRMNLKTKTVELKTNLKYTKDPDALQKGADFLKAFTLGFDLDDAIALLRLDDLYIETFEIKDVKTLQGDHLSRAIGRIAGKDGRTKFSIENATRTRLVIADSKIHILGGFTNIKMAREAVMSLILGAPPGKVYGNLRTIASRLKERY
ncbi:hypothetical protein QEN19_002174 [Hanseniaspora menglaensis]